MQKLLNHIILFTAVGFFVFFQVWPVIKPSVSLRRKFPTYRSSTKGKLLLHIWGSLSKRIVWANEQQGKRSPLSVLALIPSVQNSPAHTPVTLKHSLIFWWIFHLCALFHIFVWTLQLPTFNTAKLTKQKSMIKAHQPPDCQSLQAA